MTDLNMNDNSDNISIISSISNNTNNTTSRKKVKCMLCSKSFFSNKKLEEHQLECITKQRASVLSNTDFNLSLAGLNNAKNNINHINFNSIDDIILNIKHINDKLATLEEDINMIKQVYLKHNSLDINRILTTTIPNLTFSAQINDIKINKIDYIHHLMLGKSLSEVLHFILEDEFDLTSTNAIMSFKHTGNTIYIYDKCSKTNKFIWIKLTNDHPAFFKLLSKMNLQLSTLSAEYKNSNLYEDTIENFNKYLNVVKLITTIPLSTDKSKNTLLKSFKDVLYTYFFKG